MSKKLKSIHTVIFLCFVFFNIIPTKASSFNTGKTPDMLSIINMLNSKNFAHNFGEGIAMGFQKNNNTKNIGKNLGKGLSDGLKDLELNMNHNHIDNPDELGRRANQVFKIGIKDTSNEISKEFTDALNSARPSIENNINRVIQSGGKTLEKSVRNLLIYGLGAGLFIVVPLIVISYGIGMLIYHKMKSYFLVPSIASESSSFYQLFTKRSSLDEVLQKIKRTLILNTEEIEKIENFLNELRVAIQYNRPYPNLLLAGPPGTGKTALAKILRELFYRYILMSGSSFSKYKDGDDIVQMDKVFSWQRRKLTNLYTPSFLFLDEVDAFAKNRNKQKEKSQKLFQHFLSYTGTPSYDGIIIAATNDPSVIDEAVYRRFPTFIRLRLPNKENRAKILKMYFEKTLKNKHFVSEVKINEKLYIQLAERLKGTSGSEIQNIVNKISAKALVRRKLTKKIIDKEIKAHYDSKQDFKKSYVN